MGALSFLQRKKRGRGLFFKKKKGARTFFDIPEEGVNIFFKGKVGGRTHFSGVQDFFFVSQEFRFGLISGNGKGI